MDGEVTIRRLFRSCRQNCISPLGHSGGELRMAVPLEGISGEGKVEEGRVPVSNLTPFPCNIIGERGVIRLRVYSTGNTPEPRRNYFQSQCLLGTNTPATTELRRPSRSPQRTRNLHTLATVEYRRCTAGGQQGSQPAWSTYLFNPFTLSTCAEL